MRPNLSLESITGALAVLGTGVIMAACGGDAPKTPVDAKEVPGATDKAAGGDDHKAGDAKPADPVTAAAPATPATPAAPATPATPSAADAKGVTGTPAPATTGTGKKPAAPATPPAGAKKAGASSCGAGTCSAKK